MKEKIKIGILTLYHDNYNFGGLLQAYALQFYISSLSEKYIVEQIDFDYSDNANYLKIDVIKSRIKESKVYLQTHIELGNRCV